MEINLFDELKEQDFLLLPRRIVWTDPEKGVQIGDSEHLKRRAHGLSSRPSGSGTMVHTHETVASTGLGNCHDGSEG